MQADLPCDPSRIYLSGLSRGAYGAWRLAIQNPDRFAALVPISGGAPSPYVKRVKHVPIWMFHKERDPVISSSESQRLGFALRRANADYQVTIYPGVGHDAWTETYENPELYDWMLKQKLPSIDAQP